MSGPASASGGSAPPPASAIRRSARFTNWRRRWRAVHRDGTSRAKPSLVESPAARFRFPTPCQWGWPCSARWGAASPRPRAPRPEAVEYLSTPHGVKLLDFGLARSTVTAVEQTDVALTLPGTITGIPPALAPKSSSDARVTHAPICSPWAPCCSRCSRHGWRSRRRSRRNRSCRRARAAARSGGIARGSGRGPGDSSRARQVCGRSGTPMPMRWRRSCARR